MDKEDKIAFSVISVLFCGVSFAILMGIKMAGTALFGWFEAADAGVSFKESLVISTSVSTVLLLVFALFAGDGIVGELPTMIVGFFVFTLFFTFSIAWIF